MLLYQNVKRTLFIFYPQMIDIIITLFLVLKTIELYPHVSMISGNIKRVYSNGYTIFHKLDFKPPLCTPKTYKYQLKKKVVTFFGGGNIIRKKAILDFNGFKSELKWLQIGFFTNLLVSIMTLL